MSRATCNDDKAESALSQLIERAAAGGEILMTPTVWTGGSSPRLSSRT